VRQDASNLSSTALLVAGGRGMILLMDIEGLQIDERPNWEEVVRRVNAAMAVTEHGDMITGYRVLKTPTRAPLAQTSAFTGSPTITIDETNVFLTDGDSPNWRADFT